MSDERDMEGNDIGDLDGIRAERDDGSSDIAEYGGPPAPDDGESVPAEAAAGNAEAFDVQPPGEAFTPAHTANAPYPAPAEAAPPPPPKDPWYKRAWDWCADYFLGYDPTFLSALAPLIVLSIILYSRSPATNYIFDEQEALLANPYVNATGGLRFIDAIHRDFWGLPPDRSVGSYRPLPNFLWRALWFISKHPFFHHIYNVVIHAINGALLSVFTFAMTRRRGMAYVAGLVFVACAVLTEAVSGIVGIADVLGGLGAILALLALRLPAWAMPFGVFFSLLVGLFSKESALVCVPLVPFTALVAATLLHPERPQRVLRTLLALVASAGAFILYVELRKKWFPSPMPAELQAELPLDAPFLKQASHAFLRWFHQAPLPNDPLNNPLGPAPKALRVAGALRVYFRGLLQVIFPKTLSGDYSFPQEPVPEHPVFFESVAGALLMVLPLLASVVLWIVSMVRDGRARPEGIVQKPRTGMRISGLLMLLLSLCTPALDVFVLRPRGLVLERWGIPWYAPFAITALSGLGVFIEGGPRLHRIDSPYAPVPLSRAGLVLLSIGFTWVVVSYFPHSNIPIVLPTVRAERFWYFPVIGSSLALAAVFSWLHKDVKNTRVPWAVGALFTAFIAFQSVQAYRHAMDYRNDLVFWEATRDAVPNSAKAHLNYSVMVGARGNMPARLEASRMAMQLAPKWAMAHVYTGDVLCRMHRADEAFPHYKEGFEIGPNEMSLIALAIQCLYDEKKLYTYEDELRSLAEKHPDTWIAFLAKDTLANSETNKGVDPKYRPRGYNEGPKEK